MTSHLLLLSLASTKLLGPERTCELFRKLGRARRTFHLSGRRASGEDVRRRVARGLSLLPLPIECLDQAVVTWYLLNVKGHAATLRIGMKLSPLLGHAWVVLGDDIFGAIPGIEDMAVVSEVEPFAS